jgi:nucleotide-binding universal stress UspA family protein
MKVASIPWSTGLSQLPEGSLEQASAGAEAAVISLRRMLWACDFSACSANALGFVIPIARAYGSEITALHVMPAAAPASAGPLSFADPALLQPQLRHAVSMCLDRFVRPAIDAPVPIRVVLREGKPVPELLALAARLPADLLVLGTRGENASERTVLGSVAEPTLGRAPCPVLAVPTQAVPPSASLFKAVLCATDFSDHATRAWHHALALAARSAARLLILHVVEREALASRPQRARAELRLHDLVTEGRAAGCKAESIVMEGSVSRDVLRIARQRAADLIVIGTQGSRALHTHLFGSNALRVVREAPCAVLTVRRT